jgi:RNA polymerase sigma-70 factor, ECF subfamily
MKTEKQIEFMKLYEPVHNSFVRFCAAKAYGVMETGDLVNETILNAFADFEKLKEKKAFLSYLFSIACNVVNNTLRKKKVVSYTNEFDCQIEDKTQPVYETKSEIELLYKALNKLPDAQKEALILFEISGFSIKEISEIQKAGISSVKQRLKRGREKLSEILCCPKISSENVLKRSPVLMNMFFL